MVDSSEGDDLVGELGHNEHPLEKKRQHIILTVMDGQTDRQTDRQTYRHTDIQTNRQTDRQADKQTNRQTGRLTVSIVPRKLPVALMSARLCRNLSMSEEVCSQ